MEFGRHLDQLRIVELLYDGVDSPEGLTPALDAMAELTRCPIGHGMLIGQGTVLQSHFVGGAPRDFEDYELHWRDQDPRFAASQRHFGQVLTDTQIVSASEFERTPVYYDFLRRVGGRHSLFVNFEVGEGLMGAHALMRPTEAFELTDVSAMQRLLPHLARTMRLRRLMGALHSEIADLRRALDRIHAPLFILDANGAIICANAGAEGLLTTGDGLSQEQGRLRVRRSREAQMLAAAIAETATFAEGHTRPADVRPESPQTLLIPRNEKRPLALVLMPLRPPTVVRQSGSPRARVLVVVHDPDATVVLDPALIAKLHGLTTTEALLASSIAQGRTLAEFAEERGCGSETAKTHLKRVMEKTGTRRQPELVRLLLGSTALHLTGKAAKPDS